MVAEDLIFISNITEAEIDQSIWHPIHSITLYNLSLLKLEQNQITGSTKTLKRLLQQKLWMGSSPWIRKKTNFMGINIHVFANKPRNSRKSIQKRN